MQIEERSGVDERTILTAMVVHDGVCGRIASRWPKPPADGLFASTWSNIVAGWCVSYYGRYGAAPGALIVGPFTRFAERSRDKPTIQLLESFLGALSKEWESKSQSVNAEYVIDLADEHFGKIALEKLMDGIRGDLSAGDYAAARKRQESFGRIELSGSGYVDVMRDAAAIKEAFTGAGESLINWGSDALNSFYGATFERDSFTAFLAPEKRGKTFTLMDVAWRGAMQRRRTAFFSVGDMSQKQVIKRFGSRAARRPVKPATIRIPKSIERVSDTDPMAGVDVDYHPEREYTDYLSDEAALAALADAHAQTRATETLLRLSVHPNSSLSVNGLRGIVQSWEREGWVPDVIVIDYADILAPPSGAADTRDQINGTWKQLRALSQELHCAVVTATQADADSYYRATMGRDNFSEDKRKLAHVTAMIGINQTDEEKEKGVARYNYIVRREDEFIESRCIWVAGCLGVCAPTILSTM